MPENALAKKLKLKAGQRAVVVNAPEGYLSSLKPLPAEVELVETLKGQFDWAQIFVRNKVELDKLAPRVIRALKPESVFWVSFPKGTSKIQTDLTRDKGWGALREADLMINNLVSVNETWSAFSLRPYREGERRQAFRLSD